MIDGETMLCNKQILTATAVSQNVVELDRSGEDVASGEPVYLNIHATRHDADAPALDIQVQVAEDGAMTSPKVIATYSLDQATVGRGGSILSAALPAKLARGYCRLNIVVTGTAPAGFMVTAWLGHSGQTNR